MSNTSEYPRVLIIYHSCINKEDQHGVSLRGWFADWPKENLAQIYSGGEAGVEKFCGSNFKLGKNERRFGSLFFKVKGSSLGQSSYTIKIDENINKLNKLSVWSLFKNNFSGWLISTGLWEIMFRPILSKEMVRFVEDFDPEIIYCQGYSLTFSWLPVMLHNKFGTPICFQTGDDWPSSLYRNSQLSILIRPIVQRAVKSLLAKSLIRLANGNLMAAEYKKRYGMSFEPLMMCDDITRFRKAIPKSVVDDDAISIVYAGNIGRDRWLSILDLCDAAESLSAREGPKIMITAFATVIPPKALNKLQGRANLQILPGPSHEDLPSYLKAADILFLPETFDPANANDIRLSLSTKAHFYMMSEKPTIIYASPVTGIVDYAKAENWSCVVEEKNLHKLTEALRKLIANNKYREQLVERGIEVALKNHDEIKVREKFRKILNSLE